MAVSHPSIALWLYWLLFYSSPALPIPLKQQDNFLFSLDVEANIVVLCPHCHKMLHHGTKEDIRPLLDLLFQKRKQALADKGIQLTWEQLCSYYGANE